MGPTKHNKAWSISGIIPGIGAANERRRYYVVSLWLRRYPEWSTNLYNDWDELYIILHETKGRDIEYMLSQKRVYICFTSLNRISVFRKTYWINAIT